VKRSSPRRLSAKKEKALGRVPWSTITSKPKSVRKVNKKRRSAEWTRAYDSPDFVAWIREQPSVVSGKGPCVAAHTENGGMSRKADARSIVPLTDAEHKELHRIGIKSFEAKYGASLAFHAARIWQRWLASTQHQTRKR
jgi:hypothetical protein